MKKYTGIVLILALLIALSACGAAANPSSPTNRLASQGGSGVMGVPSASGVTSFPAAQAPLDSQSKSQIVTGSESPASPAASTAAQSTDRIVIKNADLKLVVKDPAATMDFITNLAAKLNGYVVSSNLYKTTTNQGIEVPQATITIRVPADQLNGALTTIKGQVGDPQTDILSEDVNGQDVTKQYTDLQSQLTNLQKAETQLQEIMGSATKTEDVLAVYNQLVQIRQQIEVIQGQINYYKESAALSAINVTLVAQASVQPLQIGGWQPMGVARDAVQSLIKTMQFLGSAVIWIVLFLLPTLIVIGLILFIIFLVLRFFWRLARRASRGKRQPPQPLAPAPPAEQTPK